MALKFVYFDFEGPRAGPIRLTFDLGGIKFEDKRFPFSEWPQHKPHTPLGQVPVLEIDGVQYTQSNAILKYAGRRAGFYPTDAVEAFKVDEVLDITEEIIAGFIAPTMRVPEDKRLALREEFAKGELIKFLKGFEVILARNGDGPFVLGNKLTIADIKLGFLLDWFASGKLDGIPPSSIEGYSRLNKLHAAFHNDPKVKEWLSTRTK